MALNYKKELEGASKTMILVHEPDVLIRMIVRMIVQKVKVDHSKVYAREIIITPRIITPMPTSLVRLNVSPSRYQAARAVTI